jgi:hypothetical protein
MYKQLSGPRAMRYHHTTAHISKPAAPGALVLALGLGCVLGCVLVLSEVPPYRRTDQ